MGVGYGARAWVINQSTNHMAPPLQCTRCRGLLFALPGAPALHTLTCPPSPLHPHPTHAGMRRRSAAGLGVSPSSDSLGEPGLSGGLVGSVPEALSPLISSSPLAAPLASSLLPSSPLLPTPPLMTSPPRSASEGMLQLLSKEGVQPQSESLKGWGLQAPRPACHQVGSSMVCIPFGMMGPQQEPLSYYLPFAPRRRGAECMRHV